ncbi:glycosyl hydrolase family 18 protein [Leifsonia sp. F6_8S_P_1B]|uniref:Glycosyl hydrolase family 18 protein n=1 Tax=Leifsonia williamsii TaxID=3035919 RepID=A0ABT8KE27_9MICO|nr:carbohydrate-binding protein [Leifsonia williamsii]MDN4614564.1 glycosyl hydrolase family 18 protein [Leifsonia williamsii]
MARKKGVEAAVASAPAASATERAQAPEADSGRRLSPWRVIGAGLVAVIVVTGGVVGFQWWSAKAAVDQKPWFASYVDVTATPRFAFENLGTTTTKDAVLSFVVSSKDEACEPSWGAAYSLDEARGSLDLDRRIARLQQQGGTVAVSFGGLNNDELAVNCDDPSKLKAAYASVVDRYKIGTIDLDLEGEGLQDADANARRATAIAALQKERRADGKSLAVWLTLPVAPSGMTSAGTDAITAMLDAKVDIAGVNVMTMDFGSSKEAKKSMAQNAEAAVTAAQRQLGILYDRAKLHQSDPSLWAKVGATPMIGQNDVEDEVFTFADAAAFNKWAVSTGIGRMSMWSANRDKTCGSNYVDTSVVSDACSGVSQGKKTFAATLAKGFDGHISLGEAAVTTAEPVATAAADDPATSPYPIWKTSSSYLKGTKIVWHRNVYQAKWWTKGDMPDDPVLNSWETPWELVGPVLPGETPIPQPTLPAGTYPNWSGTAAYDKGQRVLFDGTPYEAKWWTQGDSPEAASADPDSSPWSPLTQDELDKLAGGSS